MATTMPSMPSFHVPNLHTAAGLRWLAPMVAAIAIVGAIFVLMLLYPHMG
jgi:hypothetical protein